MQENEPSTSADEIVGIKNLEEEFDVELAKELAQAYLDDTVTIIEKIQNALNSNDQEGVRSTAHMLKGCSRAIQAMNCEKSSAILENHARDGNLEAARAGFADVVEAYAQTKKFLIQYLAS